jgi:hypothetical protein
MGTGRFPPGENRSDPESDRSYPSMDEVKNGGAILPAPYTSSWLVLNCLCAGKTLLYLYLHNASKPCKTLLDIFTSNLNIHNSYLSWILLEQSARGGWEGWTCSKHLYHWAWTHGLFGNLFYYNWGKMWKGLLSYCCWSLGCRSLLRCFKWVPSSSVFPVRYKRTCQNYLATRSIILWRR